MSSAAVRQWLLEHTPLEPTLLAGAGFDALVAERISVVTDGDECAYIHALDRAPDEVERLTADIAVPETWLFRYPRSFDLLVEVLRRHAVRATEARMCSIGCATGLEPYSMAMAALHAGWSPEHVRIDAFDRNPDALAIAAAGAYGPAAIRSEIPAWAANHLEHDADLIRIDHQIRAMVRFLRIDVTASGIQGPYDVVFCRNMLIYLNASARARLVREICAALTQGGALFVGHAEQFLRAEPLLSPIAAPHAFALERIEAPARQAIVTVRPASPAEFASEPPTAAPLTPPALLPRTPPAPPPSASASLAEARSLADAGHMGESERLIRSIIERNGPSASAMELLGLIRMAANDADTAKRLFEQAVYLEPHRAACLLQLAMIAERTGDRQRAAAYWDRARRASAAQENIP